MSKKQENIQNSLWIHGPAVDLLFFSFGWVLILIPFGWIRYSSSYAPLWDSPFDPRNKAMAILLLGVLLINFVHRNITHVLVYGDPAIFRERKKQYILLPLLCLGLTALSFLFTNPKFSFSPHPLFFFLILLSISWTIFHSVMQKLGFLRIYSRKQGHGTAWVEKSIVLGWFVFLFLILPTLPHTQEKILTITSTGRFAIQTLKPFLGAFQILAILIGTASLGLTVYYGIREWKNRGSPTSPKNIFLASLFMLYGLFFYDFFVAYVAFAFSHALEYLAFVNLYSHKKYLSQASSSSWVARAVRHQVFWMILFAGLMILLYWTWSSFSPLVFSWFFIGTSFLHFIYDSWIWKIRKPQVGEALGLSYQTTAS